MTHVDGITNLDPILGHPCLHDIPQLTDVNRHSPVTVCLVSGCMYMSLSMRELTSDLKPSLRLTQLRPAQ